MSRRSMTRHWAIWVGLLALALPPQPAFAASAATAEGQIRAESFTVFGFSQSAVNEEDQQVYQLAGTPTTTRYPTPRSGSRTRTGATCSTRNTAPTC